MHPPNLWFNVCALFVLTSVLVLYYTKFSAPFKKYNVFLVLVWFSLISTLASLCNNLLPGHVPIAVLRVTNTVYFLFHGMLPMLMLLYVHSLTDQALQSWHRLIPWMLPTAFSMLLILTSWYTDALFRLGEDGSYHRGMLMPLIYLIAGFNFVGVLYRLAREWRAIPRQEAISMVVFLILAVGAVLVQMVYPWLLVENFACSICLMISQLSIQNPELILDGGTGMLNKQGLSNLVSPLFDRKQSFQIGFLAVDNYHVLEKIFGYSRLENRMSALTGFLQQHGGVIFARPESGLYCFVSEDFRSSAAWNLLLRDLDEETLTEHLTPGQISMRMELKLGVFSCPQDVDSFSGLMELIYAARQLPMDTSRRVMRLNQSDLRRLKRFKLVDALVRSAVRDNSLSLVYQPIYDVREKRFCSAEALMRMSTEQSGGVPPSEFIRIAEDNGAILQLTQFTLESVCRFLNTSKLAELKLRRIHINLSAVDCAQKNLSARILDTLSRQGLDTGLISMEVTETALSSMSDSILGNLSELSGAGVTIMLDDYGTGYSNLNRLNDMPLDVVKLDKSLVDHIADSEPARIVLEHTVQMMKRLNKKVLVEGVETKEQAEHLIALGVDYIQGYYYAKPMSPDSLVELFRRQAAE